MNATPLDILIVGGGPVGAAVGTLLLRAAVRPLSIGILEPRPQPDITPDDTRVDARVLAFSRASKQVLEQTGAWDEIQPFAHPYERMRVWDRGTRARGAGELVFDAADVGEPNLGHIIEPRRVTAALLRQFQTLGGQMIRGGFQALDPPPPLDVARHAQETGMRVNLRRDAERLGVVTSTGRFAVKLLIGADGARSAVRAAADIKIKADSYSQTAIVARIRGERPHEDTAWQRFLGHGTLAFLPLGDGAISIVWSVDDEQAKLLLSLSPEAFAQELRQQSDDVLGALTLEGERSAFPLQRLKARNYTASRIALIGDAAHVVHPLAGLGVNLGLEDAALLADLVSKAIAHGEDPGARLVLRAYERTRKADNELMDAAIDAFNRFLAHDTGLVSSLARLGLRRMNRHSVLKRFFIEQALG